jgi:hypothetical protein
MNTNESAYVRWLRHQGVPLFEAGGTVWRTYHRRVLVPAPCVPIFVQLNANEAREILRRSGAFLLRYCSDPRQDPSNWWYIICDHYDIRDLTHKTRQKINRGRRDCQVRQVDAYWLMENGYECYQAAFQRYNQASPVSRSIWQAAIRATATGPFEHWVVFVGSEIAGFCEVVVESGYATTIAGKYDGRYFKHRPVDFLTHCLAQHYVVERGLILNNGMRSVLHDTNMQDFLLSHGFRKLYCRLEIRYVPLLSLMVNFVYPIRHMVRRLPQSKVMSTLGAALLQEEIKRSCVESRTTASDHSCESSVVRGGA